MLKFIQTDLYAFQGCVPGDNKKTQIVNFEKKKQGGKIKVSQFFSKVKFPENEEDRSDKTTQMY